MHAAHLVPELALARVVTAGGPYRPGDDLSLAFTTPTVSRLVAHDAQLRAKCVPLERALVPETIAVVITHCAAPYESGEILTLSFVDPRIARIHESLERQAKTVAAGSAEPENVPLARQATAAPATERRAHSESMRSESMQNDNAQSDSAQALHVEDETAESWSVFRSEQSATTRQPETIRQPDERKDTSSLSATNGTSERETGERFAAETPAETNFAPPAISSFERPVTASDVGVSYSSNGAAPPQIHAGEPMTFQANARLRADATQTPSVRTLNENDAPMDDTHARATANGRVTVRLEWTTERLRRFVQVVDKLFTIDRLGWYRHSLAMRLLIPDKIGCGDLLADVEAMRHLQALRTAAVESLGKPLLAACMPGFSITSEWLDSIESPREARAIAGLRDALSPYADDGEAASETPSGEARYTTGTISRTELLAENLSSVEAFLPLLIPTSAHDTALGVRLAEYRRLLIELFAQTARAGEPVRLQQMAQPNHSLDDRLWQLVGAAAEAFGGFAHA